MTDHLIHIHPEAPEKPPLGAACNGCGACCLLETCPVARLRFLRRRGPCPALQWSGDEGRYRCGLVVTPGRYLPLLPNVLSATVGRMMGRWVGAGIGCDFDAEMGDVDKQAE